MNHALSSAGKLLAFRLFSLNVRVVLAESCTAGMAAATLAETPGISRLLCGSLVTYQNETKERWLGVSPQFLEPPGPGPVSEPVARSMALGALRSVPDAQLSAAITGHLGPGSPPSMDGLIWMAVAHRFRSDPGEGDVIAVDRRILPPIASDGLSIRRTRQRSAATELLTFVRKTLDQVISQ